MDKTIRIGALISGGGSNLQAIIDGCESGKIKGEMGFVGSDNPDARGLQRAEKHGIPSFVVDYKTIIQGIKREPEKAIVPRDFDLECIRQKQSFFTDDADSEKVKTFLITRAVAEESLFEKMDPFGVDLLVLAGFMRNLTPYFIDKVNADAALPKIMNIHPALLPSFPGVDGYGDTFRYGCKVGGCTVHFIDYGEDSGPIIGQKTFPIQPDDTLGDIKEKGLKQEWELYPECIQLFAEDRLTVEPMSYVLDNGQENSRTLVRIKRK